MCWRNPCWTITTQVTISLQEGVVRPPRQEQHDSVPSKMS